MMTPLSRSSAPAAEGGERREPAPPEGGGRGGRRGAGAAGGPRRRWQRLRAGRWAALAAAGLLALVAGGAGAAPAGADAPGSSLTLSSPASPAVGDEVTLSFTTAAPSSTNWVGVYRGSTQPGSGNPSLVWAYTPGGSGSVTLDTSKLSGGPYTAYLLANDGYGILATSAPFSFGSAVPNSLTLTSPAAPVEGDSLTFGYTTPTPSGTNWVGVYDGSRKPGDGASLVWAYTPNGSGSVTLDTSGLTGGPYTAYLLANDGYNVLAQTAPFSFAPYVPPTPPHFAVTDFTARTVHTGEAFSAALKGLWMVPAGATGGAPTFRKVSGDAWLTVSADGTVSGTAPARAPRHPALVTVAATDSAGHADQLTVAVPVTSPRTKPTLKTASWNLWHAGTHVDDSLEKQIQAVLGDDLDVVGLQETQGTAAQRLADALGWYAYQSPGDLGVISRYPISDPLAPTAAVPAAAVTVHPDAAHAVRVWTAHLDETGYGPYAACLDGDSAAQTLAAERDSVRAAQATALAAALHGDLSRDKTVPVVLAADLASPSGLDWTARTSAAHCGAGAVDWPVTATLAHAGLADAFRQLHPDPATDPGDTWSPVLTTHPGTTAAEPQDRIDYVDYAGKLRPTSATALVTGWPKAEPDTADNSWPSDHAAAVAAFTLG